MKLTPTKEYSSIVEIHHGENVVSTVREDVVIPCSMPQLIHLPWGVHLLHA